MEKTPQAKLVGFSYHGSHGITSARVTVLVFLFFIMPNGEEYLVQFTISQFTPDAEQGLKSRPNPLSHRGCVSHAECVVVIRIANAVISLSKTEIALPKTEIHDTSIGGAVCALLKDICGVEASFDQQVLMGKFTRGHTQSPVYVVSYFPNRDERIALTQCSDVFCFEREMLHARPSPIVPPALLTLLLACSQTDSLGFDEDGKLVLWTPEVNRGVLKDLSSAQYGNRQPVAA